MSDIRRIELDVQSCRDCPYLSYDGFYSRSHDSGWDCEHEDGPGRVIDDYENSKLKGTPWPFPEKCPLPKKKE